MSDELDSFLSNISKKNNFNFGEKSTEKPKVKVEEKKNSTPNFNVSDLLESKQSTSILKDIPVSLTEEERQYFKNLNTDSKDEKSSLSESRIRDIMQEELQKFFKGKTVLKESEASDIIYFKIGKSLFKGVMQLVETDK